MLELIGTCVSCGTEVFCRDGFLDGVHINGELFCMECAKEAEDK